MLHQPPLDVGSFLRGRLARFEEPARKPNTAARSAAPDAQMPLLRWLEAPRVRINVARVVPILLRFGPVVRLYCDEAAKSEAASLTPWIWRKWKVLQVCKWIWS